MLASSCTAAASSSSEGLCHAFTQKPVELHRTSDPDQCRRLWRWRQAGFIGLFENCNLLCRCQSASRRPSGQLHCDIQVFCWMTREVNNFNVVFLQEHPLRSRFRLGSCFLLHLPGLRVILMCDIRLWIEPLHYLPDCLGPHLALRMNRLQDA